MDSFPINNPAASNIASIYDKLFFVLLGLAIFFTVGVIGMMAYYAAKYRADSKVKRDRPEHENMKVEAFLIVTPTVLSLAMFFWGAKVFAIERVPPANSMEIFVIGKQWMWEFQHPDGIRENDVLTVPVNTPVRLTMISQDVIHSLYLPAFRTQYQVLPGRYTSEWFTATQVGRFPLLCNLYCGMNHSKMNGYVQVLSRPDYEKWLKETGTGSLVALQGTAAAGQAVFTKNGCGNCHGPADTAKGPSLDYVYGAPVKLADGRVIVAGDDYIRESIVNPNAQIAAGYEKTMPAYPKLSEQELWVLNSYIRSLSQGPSANANLAAGGSK